MVIFYLIFFLFASFSHQQVDAACAGFPDSGIIGRGGFGPVFRGRFLGQDVAVKRLDGYGLQGLPNFLKEVQVWNNSIWVR